MRSRWNFLWCALGLAFLAAPSRADVIELNGGRAVHGRIVEGQSGEDGLAVQLFDTGGVIVVKWDHIVPARAKDLRVKIGIDVPDEVEILRPGHRVLTTNGQFVEGRALNPDEKDKPLQLKTRTSVQVIERAMIARIDEVQLPGLAMYTPDELYQILRDENPPETPSANLDLALKAMRIGALSQAQQHLGAAKLDPVFLDTPDGRRIPTIEKQLEVLVKSKGAQDMVTQIRSSMRSNRWNEALSQLDALDAQYKDEQVRKLIRFDLLSSSVLRGREVYFKKEVQKRVYSVMARLVEAKAREKKPLREDPNAPRGVAQPGTLAAARQFVARDLPVQIWEKVQADLGLKPEEMDHFWKERSGKNVQQASYGTGSFTVMKKVQQVRPGQDPNRQRRPPGAGGQAPQAGPQRQTKEDKPKTEEEWWESLGGNPGPKVQFLIALFVEQSGIFEIVRTDESELCGTCGGRGVLVSAGTDGSQSSEVCTGCNGSQKVRKVMYR